MPPGMEALYQRTELAIATNPKQADCILATTLICWTVCAQCYLSLKELSQALLLDIPNFLDLKTTIQDVCGHSVIVDQTTPVAMIHQSARDYLTKTPDLRVSIDLDASHGALFAKYISFLTAPYSRSKIGQNQYAIRSTEPFLTYAATAWSYHLHQATVGSSETLDILVDFLEGISVLLWIHSLALLRQLEVLLKAAKTPTSVANMQRKINAGKSPLLHRLQDLELLDLWATDFPKIVGKFGRHLFQNPTVIYKIVPSALSQKFHYASSIRSK
ncbi:hypothetical protein MMC21_002722 [Puttea exsequens]|nr:hypothetical protein [Puttea exsequens]